MAVDPAVQDFIARSMAENNRSLMSEKIPLKALNAAKK